MRSICKILLLFLLISFLIVDAQNYNGAPLMTGSLFGFDSFAGPSCTGNKIFGGLFPSACTQISPGVFRTAVGDASSATIYECSQAGCPLAACNMTVISFVSGSCDTATNSIYTFYSSPPTGIFPSGVVLFEQFLSPCALVETSSLGYFVGGQCVPNGDGSFFQGTCISVNSTQSLVNLHTCTDSKCTNCQSEIVVADDCANSQSIYHCPSATPPPPPPPGFTPPFVEISKYAPGSQCSGQALDQVFFTLNCIEMKPGVFQKAQAANGIIEIFTCIDSTCGECGRTSLASDGACQNDVTQKLVGTTPSVFLPGSVFVAGASTCNSTAINYADFFTPACRPTKSKFEALRCNADRSVSRVTCDDNICTQNCVTETVDTNTCHPGNDISGATYVGCLESASNNTNNNNNNTNNNPPQGITPPFWGFINYDGPSCTGNLTFGRIQSAACTPVNSIISRMAVFNAASGIAEVFECDPKCLPATCVKVKTFTNNSCDANNSWGFFGDFLPNVTVPNDAASGSSFADVGCGNLAMQFFSVQNQCERFLNQFEKISCASTDGAVTQSVCTDSACTQCKSVTVAKGTCAASSDFGQVSLGCFGQSTPPTNNTNPNNNTETFFVEVLKFSGSNCTGVLFEQQIFSSVCAELKAGVFQKVAKVGDSIQISTCIDKVCGECSTSAVAVPGQCQQNVMRNIYTSFPPTFPVPGIVKISGAANCQNTVVTQLITPLCRPFGTAFELMTCASNSTVSRTICSDSACTKSCVTTNITQNTCVAGLKDDIVGSLHFSCIPNNNVPNPGNSTNGFQPPFWGIVSYSGPDCTGTVSFGRVQPASCTFVNALLYRKATLNIDTGLVEIFECDSSDCSAISCVKVASFSNNVCDAGKSQVGFFGSQLPNVTIPARTATGATFVDNGCTNPASQFFSVQNKCIPFLNKFESVSCSSSTGTIVQSVCKDSACTQCSAVTVPINTCATSKDFGHVQYGCDFTPAPPSPPLAFPLVTILQYSNANCSGTVVSGQEFSANCFPFGTKFRLSKEEKGQISIFECPTSSCNSNCTVVSTFANGTCSQNQIVYFFPTGHGDIVAIPTGATVYRAASDAKCNSTVAFGIETSRCFADGGFFKKISCDGNRIVVKKNCSDLTCAFCATTLNIDVDTCSTEASKFTPFASASFTCFGVASSNIKVTASLASAAFSDSGDQILIHWDSNGTLLPLFMLNTGFFPCSLYFDGAVAQAASCTWKSSSILAMFPSSAQKVKLPLSLTLFSATQTVISGTTTYIVTMTSQTIAVALPAKPVAPTAVIIAPSTVVNPCFGVQFDGSRSSGAQLTYSWTTVPSIEPALASGAASPFFAVAPTGFALNNGAAQTYSIRLFVSNIFGQESSTNVSVLVAAKLIPQIILSTDKSFSSSTVLPVRLEAKVAFPTTCVFNISSNFNFSWTVFASSDLNTPVLVFNQKALASINAGTLAQGAYKAVFKVNFQGETVTDFVEFTLVQPAPIAVIKPIALKFTKGQNVTLNANSSFFITKSTDFAWTCVSNGSSCVQTSGALTLPAQAVIVLATGGLSEGVYQFCVHIGNEAGSSNACISIEIVSQVLPFISILPLASSSVNPAEKLIIQTSISYAFPLSRLVFSWTVTNGNSFGSVKTNASNLIIPANVLIAGSTYTLRVVATDSTTNAQNFAEISFSVNSPPIGGSISVSPSSGLQINTTFSVNCIGASDSDGPVSFRFGYFYQGDATLYYIGGLQASSVTSTTFSRAGNVTVIVFVFDQHGAFTRTETTTPIIVAKDPNLNAKSAISGSLNNIETILTSGDSLGALNTLSNAGQILGSDANLSEADKQQLASNLVNTLNSFFSSPEILNDPAAVENVASTLLVATSSSTSIAVQEKALEMIATLLQSGTLSVAASQSTFGVLSSCLTSGQTQPDASFIQNVGETLNALWNANVGALAPGDDPLVFSSPFMDLVAAKLDAFSSSNPISSGGCTSQFQFADPDQQGDLSLQLVAFDTDFSSQDTNSTSKVVEINLVGGVGTFSVNVTIPLKTPINGVAQCRYRNAFGNGWTSDPSCVLMEQTDTFIICSCSHLTQFSAEVETTAKNPPQGQGEYVSETGKILGIVFGILGALAILSIILYVMYYLKVQRTTVTDLPE